MPFVGAGVLAVILFLMLSDNKFMERLETLTVFKGGSQEEMNDTSGNRIEFIKAGFRIFEDNHPCEFPIPF